MENNRQLYPPFLQSIIIFSTWVFFLSVSYSVNNELFTECSRPFDCGSLKNIPYPFWGSIRSQFCGLHAFQLDCKGNQYPVMQINGLEFRVLKITESYNTMTIARSDLSDNPCSAKSDTLLSNTLFDYAPAVYNLTLIYGCGLNPLDGFDTDQYNFSCGNDKFVYYANDSLMETTSSGAITTLCSYTLKVPISRTMFEGSESGKFDVPAALKQGFEVKFKYNRSVCKGCEQSDGTCGSNTTTNQFICYCPHKGSKGVCFHHENSSNWRVKAIIGVAVAVALMLLTCAIICCFKIRKSMIRSIKSLTERKTDKDLEASIKKIERYKFSQIKKMTNNNSQEVGRGAFGVVYKGKLQDGSDVAVKILTEPKENGDKENRDVFINEVASISKTAHVNVIKLLGLCLERRKRALIYEYMPKGSLEKFIFINPSKTTRDLAWEKLLQIAIEIARGLHYLHHECSTRILHLDIKPTNILLDENLTPKISDFGLAKLYTRNESTTFIKNAKGTMKYVAPELLDANDIVEDPSPDRNIKVSPKSDVYSYGVMILEMVGGRKYTEDDAPTEINFPKEIHKNLELGRNIELHGVLAIEEDEIAKKMAYVGFHCVQRKPEDRPYMKRVIRMLEGRLEELHFPPNPFLSSPLPQVESPTI